MALTIEAHRAADNAGIRPQMITPGLVRHDYDRWCTDSLVATHEISSQTRGDTENAEEIVRHESCFQLHGVGRSRLEHSGIAVKSHRSYSYVFESRDTLLQVNQFRVCEFLDVGSRKRIRLLNHIDRILVRERQGSQQNRIH